MVERIHKFYFNGVHCNWYTSGSVHVVEKIVYEMIDDYEKFSDDEIFDKFSQLYNDEDAEAFMEIDSLIWKVYSLVKLNILHFQV